MPASDTETIIAWKSNGLSDKSIKPSITTSNSLASKLEWIYNSKVAWAWGKFVCFYELDTWSQEI